MNRRRIFFVCLGTLVFSMTGLKAQVDNRWKIQAAPYKAQLAPHFLEKIQSIDEGMTEFTISVSNYEQFVNELEVKGFDRHITKQYPAIKTVIVRLRPEQLFNEVLKMKEVSMVDKTARLPREERAVENFDRSVNQINFVHHQYPEWNGNGINISIKERSMDSLDIDFADRFISSNNPIPGISRHANTMATMAAGAGNTSLDGIGVARKAGITSTSFLNLFPEDESYYETYDLSIQNHSYGLGIENFYGAEAAAYDDHIYRNDYMVHVFSSGNIGDSTSTAGPYAGVEGFANITGAFKMGKNVITVGAISDSLEVQSRSSHGPAYDGRVKPELVALGQDGSSGAAAITSGITALLQQGFFDQEGRLPHNGLIRAILLNSADDLRSPGPDFFSGYGNVNAKKAINTLIEKRYFTGEINQGEMIPFTLEVPANAKELKITLAWIDPPAAVNAGQALINDLDLMVVQTASNLNFLPWVLDHSPDANSLKKPATIGVDRINNQEQVLIADPEAGEYLIEVSGHRLGRGPQRFFIAYQWDVAEELELVAPTASDAWIGNKTQFIRWSGVSSSGGQLSYRIIGTDDWKLIDADVDLNQPFLSWKTPDTTALFQLQLQYDDTVIYSDPFSISQEILPEVDLDCADSLLLSWNPLAGIESYEVFYFNEDQLLNFKQTENTSVIVQKALNASDYYAVAPILADGSLGRRSNSLFLPFQSAGCYYVSFFATLNEQQAELALQLGSTYEVRSIDFQKWEDGTFKTIKQITNFEDLLIINFDNDLDEGVNLYRAQIVLTNGQMITSDESSILYVLPNEVLFYPNPVSQSTGINLLSNDLVGATVDIYDTSGRLIISQIINNNEGFVNTSDLPSGIYFYQVSVDGKRTASGRIVIK